MNYKLNNYKQFITFLPKFVYGINVFTYIPYTGINISVPIFDYTNNAIAALTIPFVDRIISKGELNLEEVKELLIKSAELLSSEMGYKM